MPLIKGENFIKFQGIRRIIGTVYSNMNCDESLKKIYSYIAESKKTKKLDNYFSIVAKHCYIIDVSSTKTFHSDVANKYSVISWDQAMDEILNKLPKSYSYCPLEVAISIVVDTCRKADDLKLKTEHQKI